MHGDPAALKVLQEVFGFERFRGPQQAIIEHVTGGGDALVLMPTGGGKSLCYQIPALLRPGTAIVVSHAGAMRAAVSVLTGLDHRGVWAFNLPYGALLSIRVWRGEGSEPASGQIVGLRT